MAILYKFFIALCLLSISLTYFHSFEMLYIIFNNVSLVLLIAFIIKYNKFKKNNMQYLPNKKTPLIFLSIIIYLLAMPIGGLLSNDSIPNIFVFLLDIGSFMLYFLMAFCCLKLEKYTFLSNHISEQSISTKYKKSLFIISIVLVIVFFISNENALFYVNFINNSIIRNIYRIIDFLSKMIEIILMLFICLISSELYKLSSTKKEIYQLDGDTIKSDINKTFSSDNQTVTDKNQITERKDNKTNDNNKLGNKEDNNQNEKELKFYKVKGKNIPKIGWWAQNGYSLTQIPLEESKICEFDTPIKGISALATWSLIKSRVPIILIKLVAVLACIIYGIVAGGESAIAIYIGFIGGMFLFIKDAQLIRGFETLNNVEDFVYFPWWFIIIKLYIIYASLIATGIVSLFLSLLLKMEKRSKLMMMPRIVMPNGVGYDSVIETALEYENSASWLQSMDESLAFSQKEAYENKINELNKLKRELHDTTVLDFSEKENLEREINKKEEKLNEDYEKNIKPRL